MEPPSNDMLGYLYREVVLFSDVDRKLNDWDLILCPLDMSLFVIWSIGGSTVEIHSINDVFLLLQSLALHQISYIGTSRTVTFEPRSSRQCISINITNDDIVEEREYFNVTLGTTRRLDPRVQFGQPTVTTVFINDDDCMLALLTLLSAIINDYNCRGNCET